MRCEVLVDPAGMGSRGRKMLDAMIEAAPAASVEVIVSTAWRNAAPVLMSYGLGHPTRRQSTDQHLSRGGRLIGWDLGYWNRDEPLLFNMRLTIDADHPHRLIGSEPADRFDAAGITLREDADPDGPIVLCGLGSKQRRYKGMRGQSWELETYRRLKQRFPGRRIVYRPKRSEQTIKNCEVVSGPIEEALRGASLVVCAHSNVAVDACIAGVPVLCEDGAAYALYRDNPVPSREQRIEFLRSLAWWQWNPTEATEAWRFIRQKLSA